ncbi:MAG TPA: tetratricopeptide repeat protein, partial [Roseiflexaceae bacterium]|nr:tetratricopeptide repeat protein [Roseiflexaceae bacterium]
LDGAMHLYQQSLAAHEALGDVRGKSTTLHAMAYVLVTRGDLDGAMHLYQQSLAAHEALGDVRGKSATLHAMANVLVTHGDLDGAMHLYQQSLAADEALGDVRGKSATLANMAVVQFNQGDHAQALHNARISLGLLQRMGATRDAAQVASLIQQMETALAGRPPEQEAGLSPARLVAALAGATVRARRGQISAADVQATLGQLPDDPRLAPVAAALRAALGGAADAAAALLEAAAPLLAVGAPAERADALAGIANLAGLLGDEETELRAHTDAAAALREAGDDPQILTYLSITLYNLGIIHARREDDATAVQLLEEAVALAQRTGHSNRAGFDAALDQIRRRRDGKQPVSFADAVVRWRDGGRDGEQFAALLTLACNLFVQAVRAGDAEPRRRLANDLALLRAARPLPLPGARDLLHVLQLRLRGEPGMAERAAQTVAALPAPLAQALDAMEQEIGREA